MSKGYPSFPRMAAKWTLKEVLRVNKNSNEEMIPFQLFDAQYMNSSKSTYSKSKRDSMVIT